VVLLSFDSVSLHLGKKELFADVSLQIGAADRIGLIGPNGSGKTSLLRLIAGELEQDGGSVIRKRDSSVGYLPQELQLEGGRTVAQMMRDRVPGRDRLERQLHVCQRDLARAEAGDDETQLLELSARLGELHDRLDHFERDYQDHVASRILAGLGFAAADEDRDLGELSGGWQMRALLASLLFVQPDLLLLDEPTNHLDMPSVAWLSTFLERYRRPFVLICHDREFLNEQVNRVVSFEPEGVRHYAGDYERYRTIRAQEEEVLRRRQENLEREREQAERFINRFRAQATKARAVQSRIKALERMEDVATLGQHRTVAFEFPATRRTSRLVLKADGVGRSYGDQTVLSGVDLSLLRGEKIGIIGPNGAGKTTLLKMLAGELAASTGEVSYGHHVEVGYFAQHHSDTLIPGRTVFEEVSAAVEGQSPSAVRSLLGALGFSGDDVDKPVRVLSGGEKARVALARILVTSTNLLIMDEPTNHLDLASSERLAEALETFDGALVFASHNRAFVRRLATRIWNVTGGRVEDYPGTLDEYMNSVVRRLDVVGAEPDLSGSRTSPRKSGKAAERERKRREAEERKRRGEALGPLRREVADLEERIAALEVAQRAREEQLAELAASEATADAAEVSRAFQQGAAKLEELTAAWERAAEALEIAEAEVEAELAANR
jgi:ATP-binding cassette subfamily F protein 3